MQIDSAEFSTELGQRPRPVRGDLGQGFVPRVDQAREPEDMRADEPRTRLEVDQVDLQGNANLPLIAGVVRVACKIRTEAHLRQCADERSAIHRLAEPIHPRSPDGEGGVVVRADIDHDALVADRAPIVLRVDQEGDIAGLLVDLVAKARRLAERGELGKRKRRPKDGADIRGGLGTGHGATCSLTSLQDHALLRWGGHKPPKPSACKDERQSARRIRILNIPQISSCLTQSSLVSHIRPAMSSIDVI